MLRDYLRLVLRLPGDRAKFAMLMVLLVVAALFEAVGLGLVFPFVQVVEDPHALHPRALARALSALHITTPTSVVAVAGGALLVVFLVKNAFLLCVQYVQMRFTYNRLVVMGERLLTSLVSRPYAYHLRRNSNELVRVLVQDLTNSFLTGVPALFSVLSEAVTAFVIACFLVVLEPVAVPLAAITTAAIAWAINRVYRVRNAALGQSQRESQAEMQKWGAHALNGIKEVQLAGAGPYFVEGFLRGSRKFGGTLRRYRTLVMIPRLTLELVALAGLVVITIVLTARGVAAERIVPVLGVLALAVVRLLPSATRVLGAFVDMRFLHPGVRGVLKELTERELVSGIPEARLAFEKSLQLEHVEYRYEEADEAAVVDVDLEIRAGEAIAFVGSSGAGKTTLADIIAGVLEPSSGTLRIDGTVLDRKRVSAWHRNIGYIPQTVFLTDDTLRSNVAFGVDDKAIDDERVWRCLALARLDEFVRGLPEQLETTVGERGVRLSGGQRQRVAIARALYREPRVLILDEATSALDGITEGEIVQAIDDLRKQHTTIVIAHRLSTVRGCDRIVVLAQGRIRGVGAWSDLLETSDDFRHLVHAGSA